MAAYSSPAKAGLLKENSMRHWFFGLALFAGLGAVGVLSPSLASTAQAEAAKVYPVCHGEADTQCRFVVASAEGIACRQQCDDARFA
jgi:hypothetical protein